MLAEGRDGVSSRDHVAGAAAISARGLHDLILMDDGLQNLSQKRSDWCF